MLTLQLELEERQVKVRVNGKESHQFSLSELSQSKEEWKDFLNNPRIYGKKLFNTLFKNAARMEFDALSKQAERTIVLVLESSELDGVAWEYAYYDNAYIVEDFAFIRALPEKERPHQDRRTSKSMERIPLLFIPANPLVDLSGEPMRELDIENEWREVKQFVVKSNAPFDLIELRPAAPAALQSVMARFQNGMIAHFSGHGAATKDGAFLLFENENGSSNPLEAREFVREVKDQAWIGFLSACQSAVAERTAFGNLARELVKAGVPFALGMQFNLPDIFAPNISGQFYNYLAQGHAVPEAARQARRAVKRENEFYVGMIALYAAHPDEAGKMGWTGSGARTLSTFAVADVSDLPTPSGFIGRQSELMNIGTSLLGKKRPNTVTLHGAGGIGKTALMRQALLRFAPSFESTLAIALDPLPSLESVLGRLERFLNLASPCSNDTKEREKIVRERLTGRETLLGLDNFETLNYALNENDSDEEKTAKSLHAFFNSLAANGVTLCVTSREVTNLPGETIEDIQGLTNENGGRLFQENVVRQKDEIYIEKTQQVSEMVGGHPLALRLLASAFDDQIGTSLDQYIEELQSHLPKARDKWTEEDRHESLRASFDFTMNNLIKTEKGKKLQIALSRLSVFIAFFSVITAAPVLENRFSDSQEEFEQMQPKVNSTLHVLWERGLLERLTLPSQNENYYLYRLYPAFNQFAAERLLPEDLPAMQETHWRAMCQLAIRSFPGIEGDGVNSGPIMSAIAHFAMPDMLKATKLKQDKETSDLLFHLAFLAKYFGNLDEAMNYYEQLLNIDEGLANLKGKSATLSAMADIFVTRGDLDRAMKLYQQALDIDEDFGDLKRKSGILHNMAHIFLLHGNFDEAIKFHQQALNIDESLGNLNGKSAALHEMAYIYEICGDLDSAMQLYQQSLKINKELGNMQNMGATLFGMANIYVTRGDLNRALDLYQQSLKINEDLDHPQGIASTLIDMTRIYVVRGDLERAMDASRRSLQIFEGLNDLQGKSVAKIEMAYIFDARGDFDMAIRLYQEALEIAESLGSKKIKSDVLSNMAKIFIAQGDLDGAMELCQQALEIYKELSDLKGKAVVIEHMGTIYLYHGDLDKALEMYEQSLEMAKQLGDQHETAGTLTNMGVALFQNHQYSAALRSLMEALTIQQRIGAKSGAQSVANLLTQFRQALGAEKFDALWQEELGQPIPEWLIQTDDEEEEEQGMTVEQFIVGAIHSAREKRPEAEQYFKEAQRLAINSNAPIELQSLGKVLQRIMIGEKNVDLSALTDELREMVEKALEG